MTIAIVDDIKEERVLLRTRLEKIFHQKDMGSVSYTHLDVYKRQLPYVLYAS